MEDLAPPPYKLPETNRHILDVWNPLRPLFQISLPPGSRLITHEDTRESPPSASGMNNQSYLVDLDRYENTENHLTIDTFRNYRTTDRGSLVYLNNHTTKFPYSVNTVHLQNPYKTPSPYERYTPKNSNLKNMYRSREMTLRPRHNNLKVKRHEVSSIEHLNKTREKFERSTMRKDEFHLCLKKSEIGVTIQQYCNNSSLHGLRYIGDASLSILERLFWIISFIAAVTTAGYFIWTLYQKWITTPIIISLSPEPMSLTEIPFPSITICNMNNVKKKEAIRITEGNDRLEKLLLEDMCDVENYTISGDLDEESGKWSTVQRFMINVSQPCTEMIYLCQWHQNITDCEKIFNPTMTDEGICCNFNSVNREFLFYNPRDWSDLNMTFPFTGIDWKPETGYAPDTPPDTVPWRPYGSGRQMGLTLVLDAEIEEYYCSSTASVGFKMLLHNPVETPKIADFGFSLNPGSETRVIISPRITTASKTIIKVPLKKRKCFFTTERKLRYYRTYTQRNCILECEANFTREICQCVEHYMPKAANTPICGKRDNLCAMQARKAMEQKLYDEDNTTNWLNITETPSCNCWPGCFEINYNIEISQSKLVSSFEVNEIYVKKNKAYFAENLAVVHLFFVDSQFTKYVKNELFGFTEFLSSTGGLLGLFMGFSFLSVVEIIYFVSLRVWCRLYRTKQTPGQTLLHVHPVNQNTNVVYPFTQ
ncbi:pickpocket protein 28 [Cephus cinctus]|uniref:Pickpocket protein 28 n=1 Tax=Cephus cinctus TaxID=211228 RepID=A0AAJ7FJ28_CEPCN|nr:pickpocket protein 28 [Cephus cinctus]